MLAVLVKLVLAVLFDLVADEALAVVMLVLLLLLSFWPPLPCCFASLPFACA
jgi:hypothetical protein